MPYIRFLYVRPGLCLQLPSDSPHGGHPCSWLTIPTIKARSGLTPYSCCTCRANMSGKGRCVKMVTSFFMHKAPTFTQAGALLLPKDFVSLSITFYTMTKIHFRPYNPNQTVLFPPRIDEDIAENEPVRMVNALVESLNLESFRKLYKECGRSPYHPRMMLKVILYAYMNNIYSCRKIEKLLHRDIHYIWLAGYEKPDFITINRFRNRVKKEINEVFTQTVLLLSSKGFISLNVEYIGGTKIESKANKYTFVWRKTVERSFFPCSRQFYPPCSIHII